MRNRQNALREFMAANGLDGVLLSSAVSIRYYTGFTSDECIVLLTGTDCTLITDFRYTIQAEAQVNGCAAVVERNGHGEQLDALRDSMESHGVKRCGYEEDRLFVAQYREYRDTVQAEWVPFSKEISAPRRLKSADEVENMQKAQRIADAAFQALLPDIRPGVSERELAAKLTYLCATLGSDGPSFDPIVGSGENGAMCHAIPGDRKIQNGDLIVLDFGCTVNGYCSDMTRTVGVGKLDEELKKIYAITLETQLLALDALHSGISGLELHMLAQNHIAKNGYGDCFGHGLGHGFGLEIHEPPRAGKNSEDLLLAGMTITVEPGIYLPGKGGVRIEDCCVVTESGCLNLVSTAKDLLII